MAKNTFTTAYNRSTDSITNVSCVKFTAPNKVKKSLGYATDINKIYDDYCKTGRLPLNGQQPIYDENFVKYDSLIEAQKLVDDATRYFVGLPANIKNQYGNSLERFVKALNAGDDFLIKNGVLNIPKKEEKIVEPINPVNTVTETVSTEPVNTATTD